MNNMKSFEETYRAYPFRPLVEFGLALSSLFVRPRTPHQEIAKGAKHIAHRSD